ncbi:hypothetical protein [Clostridium sp.]|jgi:hypothetical protein|uniref:hypothetical protein n=1 Tax=Clostridium sp. TaxID=1506 RepID=UPI003EEA9F1D
MRYKKLYQFSILILLIILYTSDGQRLDYLANTNLEKQNIKNKSPYLINKNEQTYGRNYDGSPEIKKSDLVSAIGIDGTIGYIMTSDLDPNPPNTPQEAIEQQENRKSIRYIPLYNKDGKTVIDKFKIENVEAK